MKKRKVLKIILAIVCIVVIIVDAYIIRKKSNNNSSVSMNTATKIHTEETTNCNNKPKLYDTINNQKIYFYCIDSVKIKQDNSELELKDYLKENSINNILDLLSINSTLYDGGTAIYRDKDTNRITNLGITIIKCNTLKDNKDIYIGPENMILKKNFCKDNNSTFVKTYTITKIEEQKKKDDTTDRSTYEVSLKQFQNQEETIILEEVSTDFQENKTYEFELMLKENARNVKDTIDSIFENSEIVDIRETNKKGLEQIQESFK